jgi:protein gp37
MSDLFQDAVSDEYIIAVTTVMLRANWHTYQVLTKRAERLENLLRTKLRKAASASHIWWGVSVEDRAYGIPRIQHLRATNAKVRFLSIEPLLEDLGTINLDGIDWVIVGGESGHGARPMLPSWVERIKEQCDQHGTLFFFKQWGGVQKKKNGRLLNGTTHDNLPARNTTSAPSPAGRAACLQDLAPLSRDWNSLITITA